MHIVQTFYDNMASHYDKLFLDWQSESREQASILNKLIIDNGFDKTAAILDCACGIGTQAIGLAALGYNVTASDIRMETIFGDGSGADAGKGAGGKQSCDDSFCACRLLCFIRNLCGAV